MADILGERDDNIPDRPTRVAEPSRESQLPKKFYKSAEVAEEEGFFKVLLDGRPVRTPGKSVLQLNSQSVMESIAIEWNAQVERIDPINKSDGSPVQRDGGSRDSTPTGATD